MPQSRRLSPRHRSAIPFLQGVPRYPFPLIGRRPASPEAAAAAPLSPPPPTRPAAPASADRPAPVRPAPRSPDGELAPQTPPPTGATPPLRGGAVRLIDSNVRCRRGPGFASAPTIAAYLRRYEQYVPMIEALDAVTPGASLFVGFPTIFHWAMESGITQDLVSRPEVNSPFSNPSTGAKPLSYGLGQVMDRNMPGVYAEMNRNRNVFRGFHRPPFLEPVDMLIGTDLRRVGLGASGVQYALAFLARAVRFWNQMNDPDSVRGRNSETAKQLKAVFDERTAGLDMTMKRALFLRMFFGASSWNGMLGYARGGALPERYACALVLRAGLQAAGSVYGAQL